MALRRRKGRTLSLGIEYPPPLSHRQGLRRLPHRAVVRLRGTRWIAERHQHCRQWSLTLRPHDGRFRRAVGRRGARPARAPRPSRTARAVEEPTRLVASRAPASAPFLTPPTSPPSSSAAATLLSTTRRATMATSPPISTVALTALRAAERATPASPAPISAAPVSAPVTAWRLTAVRSPPMAYAVLTVSRTAVSTAAAICPATSRVPPSVVTSVLRTTVSTPAAMISPPLIALAIMCDGAPVSGRPCLRPADRAARGPARLLRVAMVVGLLRARVRGWDRSEAGRPHDTTGAAPG